MKDPNDIEDQMIERVDIARSAEQMRDHVRRMFEGLTPKERELVARRFLDRADDNGKDSK